MERRIIEEVVESNQMYTIYFKAPFFKSEVNFEKIEVSKVLFNGMKNPKKGDTMDIGFINNKIVFHLNGVLVGSKRKYLVAPQALLDAWTERRKKSIAHIEEAKKRMGLL